jgi:hypothetical protein
MTPADLVRQHIPSLTNDADIEIDEAMSRSLNKNGYYEWADAAIRYCACGERVDGFYQYVDHLIGLFGEESHFGG